ETRPHSEPGHGVAGASARRTSGTTARPRTLVPVTSAVDTLTVPDVLRARKGIRCYLRPTALLSYPALDGLLSAHVFVQPENHSPIGSFKARGSLNALSAHTRERRVVACSTGNHGMGVAYAAKLLGLQATVVVPEWANREKTSAIEALGGRVVFSGRSVAES